MCWSLSEAFVCFCHSLAGLRVRLHGRHRWRFSRSCVLLVSRRCLRRLFEFVCTMYAVGRASGAERRCAQIEWTFVPWPCAPCGVSVWVSLGVRRASASTRSFSDSFESCWIARCGRLVVKARRFSLLLLEGSGAWKHHRLVPSSARADGGETGVCLPLLCVVARGMRRYAGAFVRPRLPG